MSIFFQWNKGTGTPLGGPHYQRVKWDSYILSCWIKIYPAFANSVDPDQLAGSALFVIQYVNLYQQAGLSNLTIRNGQGIWIYSAWQGLKFGDKYGNELKYPNI